MINSYHIEIRSLRLIWVDFVNKSEIKRLPKLTAFYCSKQLCYDFNPLASM